MGKKSRPPHQVKNFHVKRQVIIDLLEVGKKKSMIYALGQVDVTDALELLAKYKKQTGKSLSFTSFIMYCYAHTVGENKFMHAHRRGRKKLILFDDVDVACVVERTVEGKRTPTSYIVRAADKKSFLEIHKEVREAQAVTTDNLSTETRKGDASLVTKLPRFIRRIIFYYMSKNPFMKKNLFGTVGLTAIGMFTQRSGAAIPLTAHNMSFVVGGIGRKPWVVDEKIVIRSILDATIAMDHDVIDGGPATRFVDILRERVRDCYGLDEVKSMLN